MNVTFKVALGVLTFAIGFSGLAGAGQFEDGLNAAERGDYEAAIRIWHPLARRGSTDAQNSLGVMYDRGHGVPQDRAAAVTWFQKAADQGFAAAQLNLGVMYENGLGVPQDFTVAVNWYRKAAEQGNAAAQLNLGVMYENGWGVRQDYVIAHMWFNLGAIGGNRGATSNRDLVAAKMTAAQVADAERLAREWELKSTPQ